MKDPARPLYGLILGGGRSRRMGVDKAALEYHGRSQTQVAYDLLTPFCEKIFVGIREEQAQNAVFAALPQLWDKYPGEGPLAAVVSAQEHHPHAAWWVLACDLPFLDSDTLNHLLQSRQPDQNATAYLSQNDGRIEPLCAIYEPSSAALLKTSFNEGMRCARRGLEGIAPVGLALPHAKALENANTPAERAAFLADLGVTQTDTPAALSTLSMASVPSKPVYVKAHLYAQLKEKLGKSIDLALNLPATETQVLEQIGNLYPDLKPLILRCRIAVDDSYLASDALLEDLKEVDIIAPVSGG